MITTPLQGNAIPPGAECIADNGCFGKGYPGDDKWLAWLERKASVGTDRFRFATAPDVVGDAHATLARSVPLLPYIRERGYPAALVGQDGMEELDLPWTEFDALFIGGTTDWKLGPGALHLANEAKERGKRLHMGRVNSKKRIEYARSIGCDSVDGTYLAFGPDINLPKLLRWLGLQD